MSFERARKTEPIWEWEKLIRPLEAEIQALENRKRERGYALFGVRFEYANDSSFERARRAESNETRINVFGRFWTKL